MKHDVRGPARILGAFGLWRAARFTLSANSPSVDTLLRTRRGRNQNAGHAISLLSDRVPQPPAGSDPKSGGQTGGVLFNSALEGFLFAWAGLLAHQSQFRTVRPGPGMGNSQRSYRQQNDKNSRGGLGLAGAAVAKSTSPERPLHWSKLARY